MHFTNIYLCVLNDSNIFVRSSLICTSGIFLISLFLIKPCREIIDLFIQLCLKKNACVCFMNAMKSLGMLELTAWAGYLRFNNSCYSQLSVLHASVVFLHCLPTLCTFCSNKYERHAAGSQ